jgi:oxygen-independent coproporphyrinogen-3 oxidase
MRCGFCNLFTTTHPEGDLIARYLDVFETHAAEIMSCLGPSPQFSRCAIGGGTPTFLSLIELERLFRLLRKLPVLQGAPRAIEMSPATVTPDKVALLREAGITRASLGVQSFVSQEVRRLGRAQENKTVRRALGWLREAGFPVLNIDLIYGIEGQTSESWLVSLQSAWEFYPEEIYLYPLYIRPLTHLAGQAAEKAGSADPRIDLYRYGRDWLLERGYHQISMRLFRRVSCPSLDGPIYCCQEDGMVGLGAGARSYTQRLHYSTEWAVSHGGVRKILDGYVAREPSSFTFAEYGCVLSLDEQKRRYLIKSILRRDGLDCRAYRERFGSDVLTDFPCLEELIDMQALVIDGRFLSPTLKGLELSDVIGPWLYSAEVTARMASYTIH